MKTLMQHRLWGLEWSMLVLGIVCGCGSRELVTRDAGEVLRLLVGTGGGRFGPGLEAEPCRYSLSLEGQVVWLRHEPTRVLGPEGLEAVRARIVETMDGFFTGYREGLWEQEVVREDRPSECWRRAARQGFRQGRRDRLLILEGAPW